MSSLGCCEAMPAMGTLSCDPEYDYKQKGINPMNTCCKTAIQTGASIQFTTEDAQRGYILSQLSEINWKKINEAQKKFRIEEPEGPKTIGELKKFLASGNIILRKKIDGTEYADNYEFDYGSPKSMITWRKPGEEADVAGYEKFFADLAKAERKTRNIITVLPVAEGLAALDKFEEITIQ